MLPSSFLDSFTFLSPSSVLHSPFFLIHTLHIVSLVFSSTVHLLHFCYILYYLCCVYMLHSKFSLKYLFFILHSFYFTYASFSIFIHLFVLHSTLCILFTSCTLNSTLSLLLFSFQTLLHLCSDSPILDPSSFFSVCSLVTSFQKTDYLSFFHSPPHSYSPPTQTKPNPGSAIHPFRAKS